MYTSNSSRVIERSPRRAGNLGRGNCLPQVPDCQHSAGQKLAVSLGYLRNNQTSNDTSRLKIRQVTIGKWKLKLPRLTLMSPGSRPSQFRPIPSQSSPPNAAKTRPRTNNHLPSSFIVLTYHAAGRRLFQSAPIPYPFIRF